MRTSLWSFELDAYSSALEEDSSTWKYPQALKAVTKFCHLWQANDKAKFCHSYVDTSGGVDKQETFLKKVTSIIGACADAHNLLSHFQQTKTKVMGEFDWIWPRRLKTLHRIYFIEIIIKLGNIICYKVLFMVKYIHFTIISWNS